MICQPRWQHCGCMLLVFVGIGKLSPKCSISTATTTRMRLVKCSNSKHFSKKGPGSTLNLWNPADLLALSSFQRCFWRPQPCFHKCKWHCIILGDVLGFKSLVGGSALHWIDRFQTVYGCPRPTSRLESRGRKRPYWEHLKDSSEGCPCLCWFECGGTIAECNGVPQSICQKRSTATSHEEIVEKKIWTLARTNTRSWEQAVATMLPWFHDGCKTCWHLTAISTRNFARYFGLSTCSWTFGTILVLFYQTQNAHRCARWVQFSWLSIWEWPDRPLIHNSFFGVADRSCICLHTCVERNESVIQPDMLLGWTKTILRKWARLWKSSVQLLLSKEFCKDGCWRFRRICKASWTRIAENRGKKSGCPTCTWRHCKRCTVFMLKHLRCILLHEWYSRCIHIAI